MSATCKAIVTIIDAEGEEIVCQGRYYGTGKVKCRHGELTLIVDPEWYNRKDPKRMFAYGEESRWTEFRVKSVLLDSKAILRK